MRRKKKRMGVAARSGNRRENTNTNPRLHAQTRKVLRAHYAAGYRVR
jgi:hypothetical protein